MVFPIFIGDVGMAQIMEGKVLKPGLSASCFESLSNAFDGLAIPGKYPHPWQSSGHGSKYFQQFPVQGHIPTLIRLAVLRF